MSFGSVLYSPADVQWPDFIAFMASLQRPLGIIIETQGGDDQAIHDVIVEKDGKQVLFAFKRSNWGEDDLFERIVQETGETQKVYVNIEDMREYDLVMSIVYAFAQHWPCMLDYLIPGKPPIPREEILRMWEQHAHLA